MLDFPSGLCQLFPEFRKNASASASVQTRGFEVPVVRGPRRYLPEFDSGGFGLISQIAYIAIHYYMQEDFKTLERLSQLMNKSSTICTNWQWWDNILSNIVSSI